MKYLLKLLIAFSAINMVFYALGIAITFDPIWILHTEVWQRIILVFIEIFILQGAALLLEQFGNILKMKGNTSK